MRRPLTLLAAFSALAVVTFFYAGCDTVSGTENVFLQPRDVTFRFSFSSDDFVVGQPVTINAGSQVDLTGQLDGFSKSEIVSGTVSRVRLARISPQAARLGNLMENVTVSLTGGGTRAIGTAATLPVATEANLPPAGGDVASFLSRDRFGAQMQFTPKVTGPEDYIVEVTLTLNIEVEGV